MTTDTYARVAFTLISRAAIFASFATVYLWTPLVKRFFVLLFVFADFFLKTYDSVSRTTAMGLFSSFGKIASIIAPFVSSSFERDNINVPSILFGCSAAACAILVCFVGAEPPSSAPSKVSDDETTPLIK